MSVGTGSINRAARSGKKGNATTVKTASKDLAKVKDAEVPVTEPEVKAEEKSAPVKKTTAKKTTTKKSTVKSTTTVQPGNECCQLTQELPIHLL